VWTVDAAAITLAKMANVATATVFYRKTALTGVPEVQTLATLKTDLGLTGTNSGDQTSIVGITGTLAQFDTACTDANFLSVAAAAAAYQPLDGQLTDLAGLAYATNALKVVRVNAGETAFELATITAGDFSGPGSSTDNALVRFDGTGGKTGQNSAFLVNDAGVPAVTSLTGLAGAIGATIADYFSTTISLDASSTYEIECLAYFLKTTAGTVVFTFTFSSAPTVASSFFTGTAATGFTTANVNGTVIHGQAHRQAATTIVHAATGSLTDAVYHTYRFRVFVRTNAATTIQLRATESAGTITPQTGSYMRATKII
jgi:hypothetical protein